MTLLTYSIQERRAKNVPNTLDNMREFDPSMLTANPALPNTEASNSNEAQPGPDDETAQDIANDPFAAYFDSISDPSTPPKVLITTSFQASKATYEFCDELVGVFPGAEFVRRKKGKGFELGRIAGWASGRGYGSMVVVNEDHKKPSKRAIYWYEGGELMDRVGRCYYCGSFTKWTNCLLQAYVHRTHQANLCVCFPPVSIDPDTELSQGHARATPHHPELIQNGFVTRLGHAVGRMFQTLFPPLPEFEGRQVVTLHNQRDFLFFRRHRYAGAPPLLLQISHSSQVCLPFTRKGGLAGDRPTFYPQTPVAQEGYPRSEGSWGATSTLNVGFGRSRRRGN